MKKTVTVVLSVFLVLALTYLGANYYVGLQAAKLHDQWISRLNGSKRLKVSAVSYKRGLFRSVALTKVTVTDPPKGRAVSFELVDTIYHGPFVFLHDPHFTPSLWPVMAVIQTRPAVGTGMKEILEKVPELASAELLTVLSIDGSAASYLDVPAFQHKFAQAKGGQLDVKWGGLTGKFSIGEHSGEAVGSCDCPSLLVNAPDREFRMEGMRGQFDSHAGIKGISVGSSGLSIGSIEATEKGHSVFTLASFGVKAQSRVDGDKINGSIRVDFNKLNTGILGMGPFAMDFEARKLDAAVLARFQKLAPVLQREGMENSDAARGQMRGMAAKIAADLLAGRPEFEIKQLDLRTDKGDLTGKARLTFDGNGQDLSRNVLALVASVNASAELSVSQALFYFIAQSELGTKGAADSTQAKTDAGQLAARLLASKYMIDDSGAFKSSASFKQGVLTVNGNKLGLGLSNMH